MLLCNGIFSSQVNTNEYTGSKTTYCACASGQARAAPGCDQRPEAIAEHSVERAVENKVARRVDGQQEVGNFAHAAHEVRLVIVAEAEDGGHDGVRCNADNEESYHGH